MSDEDEPRVKPTAKEGEWSAGLPWLEPPKLTKPNPIVKKFQEDYAEVASLPNHIEPYKGNRAQRALLLTSKHLENVAHQISALATEYGDPDEAAVRRIEDAVAARIAKSLREKTGAFQMARKAVAEWIEEGKWRE